MTKKKALIIGGVVITSVIFQLWCHNNIPESYRRTFFTTMDYLTDRKGRPVIFNKFFERMSTLY